MPQTFDREIQVIEPRTRNRARAERTTRSESPGIVIGRLMRIDEDGQPRVEIPGSEADAAIARRTVDIVAADVGREVVLIFDERHQPIITGLLKGDPIASPPVQAEVDGEIVTLEAEREIVLRCGKASITLTRAGKVLIRGTYVLSRSSGANRIKGGSVQIN
jgi:hypothetical protein